MSLSRRRKTKIVATLGPASNSPEIIRKMIVAGLDVARLNFSHGTHEDHLKTLQILRREAEALGKAVAVLQDLCGPKLRIEALDGGQWQLDEGERVVFSYLDITAAASSVIGSENNEQTPQSEPVYTKSLRKITTKAFSPQLIFRPGQRVLLADGRIVLIVEQIIPEQGAICLVQAGGQLRSRAGISLPDTDLSLPSLTEKDLEDMHFAVLHSVDYVALSFVSSPRDVLETRQALNKLGGRSIPIIAKIERSKALENISGILGYSDALMVARGDLGLEIPLEKVPGAQRFVISSGNAAGVPVITATQMLMSMVDDVRPTRAEVSDVCTAVRDGTDAVMLSEETAIGHHPVLAVEVLHRILREAEKEQLFERSRRTYSESDQPKVAEAISYAACSAAEKIAAPALVACTHSGATARIMAKYRPAPHIFGVTSSRESFLRMALYWGTQPVLVGPIEQLEVEEEIQLALATLRDTYGYKPGSQIVITAGPSSGQQGTTNLLQIREVPRKIL